MWQLTTPTTRRAELDFSSSGQSKISVTQLWHDSVQIINGAIYMEQEIYTNTLCKISDFPSFEMLEPLSTLEAGKLFQLEAPACVLGHILNPLQLNQDMIIASSQGKLIEQTKELTSLVNRLLTNIHPAKLNSVTEHDQIISLYLDIAGLPEWKALSYNGSRYSLYLEPG